MSDKTTSTTAPTPPIPNRWRSIGAIVERLNAGAETPTMTQYSVRHYVRHAHENGLAPYVRRLGRKILIDEYGFHKWLSGEGQ